MPAAQAVHTKELDAAVTPPNLPAVQLVQALEPANVLYDPDGQLVHELAPGVWAL